VLEKHTRLHISTHGLQRDDEPLNNYFQLHDGKLRLADVMEIEFNQTNFASLAACHTAAGAEHLPDEALHLAAGLQLAGVRGLLAAMWAVEDGCAAAMTPLFYDRPLKKRPGGAPIFVMRRSAFAKPCWSCEGGRRHCAINGFRSFISVSS
jgi:CHAT domain-containing protein